MNFFKMVRDEARREKELIERKEVYYSDIKNNIIEYIELWARLSKISWFASGEQISHQLFAKQIIDLRETVTNHDIL